MGTAFIGVADDPSALVFNPSGLTQVDNTQAYGGVTAFYLSSSLRTRSGEKDTSEDQVFFPPHLYITSDFGNDRFGSGFGIYSPFGYGGRHWGDNGPARFITTDDLMATLSIDLAFAWEVFPRLAIGGSGYYLLARNETSRLIDQSALGSLPGRFESETAGGNFGYSLSLLFHFTPAVRAGLNYRSAVNVTQCGDASVQQISPALQPIFGGENYETDVEIETEFPAIIGCGISWKIGSKWLVSADIERTFWSSFQDMRIDFDEEVPQAGFTDITVPFKWRDVWSFKAGAEYCISDAWRVRAGYAFIENPVPDETFSPANPDADLHVPTIGLGYQKSPYWADIFLIVDLYEDRAVDNAILSGKYENDAGFAGFSIGYSF